MDSPTFDSDGYPTEETLEAIRTWPHSDFEGLMKFTEDAWFYPDRVEVTEQEFSHEWYFSTGGWSGNESVVHALEDNFMFWTMCWRQSRRGGHYWFEVKDKQA